MFKKLLQKVFGVEKDAPKDEISVTNEGFIEGTSKSRDIIRDGLFAKPKDSDEMVNFNNESVLDDMTELRNRLRAETIGGFIEDSAQRGRVYSDFKKRVTENRLTLNEKFMLDVYGIDMRAPGKKRHAFYYPSFMHIRFTGFVIGKSILDGKVIVFGGDADCGRRNIILRNKPLRYFRLLQAVKSGKPHVGFMWHKISDVELIKKLYFDENTEYYDEESRKWLTDFLLYLEYVEKYKVSNPNVLLELSEVDKIYDEISPPKASM